MPENTLEGPDSNVIEVQLMRRNVSSRVDQLLDWLVSERSSLFFEAETEAM